jgi:SAM-dependent methyltransferase
MTQPSNGPGLFEGTAPYYARYRRGYPAEVIDLVVERFALDRSTRVLDLGCGTGQLAIPLAARHIPVHAVDPDLDLLTEGLRAERAANLRGIAWYAGDDRCVEQLHLPILKLCTMGASFHWMDRDGVLKALDRLIARDGGVAVLGDGGSIWSGPDSGWPAVVKQVVMDFLGPERRAGGSTYQRPAERHETVLARSSFRRVDKVDFTVSETKTIEDIVGLELSTSYASPAQLGVRLAEFRRVLEERLRRLEPSGVFPAERTIEVLVATR